VDAGQWTAVASVAVALIAALSARASQRAAANASQKSVETGSRTEIEKEAFERAEGFLTGTITRQDAEIAELRREVDGLRKDVRKLRNETASKDSQIRALSAALAAHGESD
jgi:predicted RNase H-like nuclease (RuvC/YqgF family)